MKTRKTFAFIDNRVTNIVMLIIGLFFVIPFSYKLYNYGIFRYQSVSVDGIVARPSRGKNLGGRPFVEYKDSKDNVYEIKSKAKTHWFFAPKKGEKVKVFFLKHDPQIAIVDSIFHYFWLPFFCVSVGVSVIITVVKRNRSS